MILLYLIYRHCHAEYHERGTRTVEIIDPDLITTISKEITLKALEKDLIPVDKNDMKTTALNIVKFYNEVSDRFFNLDSN